jgi:phage gp29-like protein
MKSDLRVKFIQPNIRTVSTWDPPKIRSALRQLQAGSFLQAATLWDAILDDDRVQAVMGTRTKGVLGLPLNFEGDNQAALEAIDDDFWDMMPEETLDELLTDGLGLGASPAQINYERKRGRWLPVLEIWHPSLLRYSEYENLWYIHTNQGEKLLEPDQGKWMLFTPTGRRRYWRKALVRSLAIPWLAKRYAISDWQRFSEVLGGGIKKGKVPRGADTDDVNRFQDDLYNLASSGVVIVPEGFDVDLVVASAHQPDAFERLIAWADKAIATAVLGQNLTTEPGANQSGITGAREVRQDVLEADGEVLSTAVHKALMIPWAELNIGNPEQNTPWPMWDTTPPPEDGKIYEYHLKAPLLKKNEMRAKLGLPALTEEEGGDEFYVVADRVTSTPPAQTPPRNDPADEVDDDPPDDPEDDPEDDQPETRQASYRMASGATQNVQAMIDGQRYADGLMKKASERATRLLESNRRAVLELIADSQNPDELRAGLTRLFEGLDSDELMLLNERVFLLAHMAGMHSVNVDV